MLLLLLLLLLLSTAEYYIAVPGCFLAYSGVDDLHAGIAPLDPRPGFAASICLLFLTLMYRPVDEEC